MRLPDAQPVVSVTPQKTGSLSNKSDSSLISDYPDDVTAMTRAYREALAKGQFSVNEAKKIRAKEKSDQRKQLTRQADLFAEH